MEFFSSQESLTAVQWMLRAIVGFIFFLILAKLMGQRSISQVGLLDFVIVLLIGNIIAHPLSDEGLGLKGSMVTMGVILILYLMGILLSLRSPKVRKLFIPAPIPLIENGEIKYKNLKKARISVDVLLSELRKEKTEDVQKVALALWEPGGTVSFFLRSQYQPLTPSTFGAPVKPFKLPKTVIKEKRIDYKELEQLGKDEGWLLNKLSLTYHHIKLTDILLGTIDKNENLNIFLYHSSRD
ncbi:DUF421 domain-containing protein [Thalassobacillus devorans]|uniref:DUF421 domain-containing protein n=1 Tax=Thalassobacillus devorans TaxID=279813 RepID=UPI0004909AE4|nr:YetF domain-containing protein [Thalassobacillus devorans]